MTDNVLIKEAPGSLGSAAVIVGDPDRVDFLSRLLDEAMLKTGVRGYRYAVGKYKGRKVAIATHGIGTASASIVIEELHRLGVKIIVRLGTAGSLLRDLNVGDIILAATALYKIGGCSTSMYLAGLTPPSSPCPILTTRIYEGLVKAGVRVKVAPVFTSDALHAETEGLIKELAGYGVAGVDMETAILFTLSWLKGFRSASVLVVSNSLISGDQRIQDLQELKSSFEVAGRAILDALAME